MLKAYLVGSVPFAYIFGWFAKKFDIRKIGSQMWGQPTSSKKPDGCLEFNGSGRWEQGSFAVLIGSTTGSGWELPALLMAIVGHNWPVWLGFHGGEGWPLLSGDALRRQVVGCPGIAWPLGRLFAD